MTDHLSPEQRHRCMRANRSKGTRPELRLGKELWRRGWHYRKNMKGVPGSPDLCFKGRKVAVFVDGEFWHGRNWDKSKLRIKSRREYWWPKIENNMARDARIDHQLAAMGWRVIRFWDSEVMKNVSGCADKVEELLRQEQLEHLHRIYTYDTRYEEPPSLAAEEDIE